MNVQVDQTCIFIDISVKSPESKVIIDWNKVLIKIRNNKDTFISFSNNFPLQYFKNIHSGFTLVHIPDNSTCSLDIYWFVTKTCVSYKTRIYQ